MNKKFAFMAALAAMTVPTAMVFADNNTQSTSETPEIHQQQIKQPEQNKQTMEIQREANKQTQETQREASKQTLETQREANKPALGAQDDQKKLDRCKNLETRIGTRINRYQNNQQMLETIYGNMTSRLTRLVVRLTALNADTTALTKDLGTLQGMIDSTKKDQSDFIASLQGTQALQSTEVCGQKDTEFTGKIGEARKVSQTVTADRAAIRKFFQTTIKTDLQAIRKKLTAEKEPTKQESTEAEKTDTATIPVSAETAVAPTNTATPSTTAPTLQN